MPAYEFAVLEKYLIAGHIVVPVTILRARRKVLAAVYPDRPPLTFLIRAALVGGNALALYYLIFRVPCMESREAFVLPVSVI